MILSQLFPRIAVTCLLLVGCASTSTAGVLPVTDIPPAPTKDRTAIYAASPTPPQATLTAVAPLPTPSPYSTANLPDVSLSESGPWLVFLASTEENGPRYLWAINDDGTGLTKLVDEYVVAFDVRPNVSDSLGATIAYVAYTKGTVPVYTLKLLSFPDNDVTIIMSLLDDTSTWEGTGYPLDEIIVLDGLKWSPGGSLLAFVGMLNGPSVDVYTYDFAGRAITRLSDQPSNAYHLNWSPDGSYLVYEGCAGIGMGGQPEFMDIWAVKADGTGTTRLIEEADIKSYLYTKEWISSTEIMLVNQSWNEVEGSDIRIVNLETGETTIVIEEPFDSEAFAAEHNTWLLTTSYDLGSLTPLILYRQGERHVFSSQGISRVQWLSSDDVFLGYTDDYLLYTITPDGKTTEIPMGAEWDRRGWYYSMITSPDGQSWTWYMLDWQAQVSDLWVGDPMTEPVKVMSTLDAPNRASPNTISIIGFDWSPDSQRLMILTNKGLWMAERPGFELVLVTDRVYADPWDRWEGEWIP
ncbi:MAG: hypothetical protein JXB07_08310 [Anaerolineae bacterium]|nr:hypothetical protein [Anaerolineae bacterium]